MNRERKVYGGKKEPGLLDLAAEALCGISYFDISTDMTGREDRTDTTGREDKSDTTGRKDRESTTKTTVGKAPGNTTQKHVPVYGRGVASTGNVIKPGRAWH